MSSQIKLVAEHAKAQLLEANNEKADTLDSAVAALKADTVDRDEEQSQIMEANAKAIEELETQMGVEIENYSNHTEGIISSLTENEDGGLDSVKEVIDTLIKADQELDDSMLEWKEKADERKAEMITEIGDVIDVA